MAATTPSVAEALRILYLTHSDEHGPSSRYRVHQYQEILARHGVHIAARSAFDHRHTAAERDRGLRRLLGRGGSFLRAALQRSRHLRPSQRNATDGPHATMIERELFPRLPAALELPLVERLGVYGLEFDDAIYLAPGRGDKIFRLMAKARLVIVGNATLADHARPYAKRLHVVPTTLDLSRYPLKTDYHLGQPPRIGWLGLPSNFSHLRHVVAALEDLGRRCHAQLVVVSSRAPSRRELGLGGHNDLKLSFEPWSSAREAELIHSFDIGIMPLDDTPYARGKCGLKLLQYMACGVPVVCSAVGVNRAIVADGHGLLAHSTGEWLTALRRLLADRDLRQELGQRGRLRVEQDYNHEVWGPRLAELYRASFA